MKCQGKRGVNCKAKCEEKREVKCEVKYFEVWCKIRVR